jgi:hypothetical protein
MGWIPNLTSIDLTRLDLTRLPEQIGGIRTDRVVGVARDSAYVMIGFGVLKFQQVQVRRRELAAGLGDNPIDHLDRRFDALESHLDTIVEQLESRLPDQAAAVLGQAHGIAKAARKQVRGLIRNAA